MRNVFAILALSTVLPMGIGWAGAQQAAPKPSVVVYKSPT